MIDTPITEHGFTGLGVGAGLAGLKPIVEFMTFNFAMQAMDQLINSAAKTLYMSGGQMRLLDRVPRPQRAGRARRAPSTARTSRPWYSHVPGLTVIAPYTAADAKGLLKSAIRYPNPVVFLENEILYGHSFPVPKLDDYLVPIGKARIAREGEHVTIVAWSMGMSLCAQGRRGTRQGEHQRRDHRPAHHPPDGHRDAGPLGARRPAAASSSRRAGSNPASAPRSRRG